MATIPQPLPIVEEIEVIEEVIEEPPLVCSCIRGARAYGVPIPRGTNAWDLTSSSTPQIGGLALFSYDPYDYRKDHVGVIMDMWENGFWVGEENFNNPPGECRRGWRYILWNDPALRGFATF